jgi:hypothetical protein
MNKRQTIADLRKLLRVAQQNGWSDVADVYRSAIRKVWQHRHVKAFVGGGI